MKPMPAKTGSTGVPMIPRIYRVVDKVWNLENTATLSVVPTTGQLPRFEPAQASMLGAWGVGEAAISISSSAEITTHHEYTIRRAGPISGALVDTPIGATVMIRGPFGTPWPFSTLDSTELLIVAGGLGLAPLRAAIERALQTPTLERLTIVYGVRNPDELLFERDLERWQRSGAEVIVTVDEGPDDWLGSVGLVTEILDTGRCAGLGPTTAAFVCGPDMMMQATTDSLLRLGLSSKRIWLSLERNMQCGIGFCGHCQLGPVLLCRDGPVVDADTLGAFHRIPEL